jgi:myo-inositol 2-dehydrogenase / D-chiro-inositol 1-dehydrogenase
MTVADAQTRPVGLGSSGPAGRDQGLQDTAVVLVRFDNGAMATAEASFHAVYGYDIRGEVFGSAGMATAGDIRRTTMTYHSAELAAFTDGVHASATLSPDGHDARAALAIALAAIASVDTGQPVRLDTVQQP